VHRKRKLSDQASLQVRVILYLEFFLCAGLDFNLGVSCIAEEEPI